MSASANRGELASLVHTRLSELGRNPFEAARIAGLERSFINDILIGKKNDVKGGNLAKLASALGWSVNELTERRLSPERLASHDRLAAVECRPMKDDIDLNVLAHLLEAAFQAKMAPIKGDNARLLAIALIEASYRCHNHEEFAEDADPMKRVAHALVAAFSR